jgi:hypothetical protein
MLGLNMAHVKGGSVTRQQNSRLFTMAPMRLAKLLALAEYYLLVPVVAKRLDKYIRTVPGLWKDIAKEPTYYLAVGDKPHSYQSFAGAMRHYIGSGFAGS